MSVLYTGIESVDKLYEANITGNLVPPEWCRKLISENGKPNMNAVMILAEIVYWYRPKLVQHGDDQGDVRLMKRFKADYLQLSYSHFENKFNLSRDQCKRALELLESLGLINRRFRTIRLQDGRRMNNVMFIELFTDKVIELSGDDVFDPGGIEPHRSGGKTKEVQRTNSTDGRTEPMTNTDITTDISTKDHNSVYFDEVLKIRNQIDYEALKRDNRADVRMIDEIVDIISEFNLYVTEPQLVNGDLLPAGIVKAKLSKVNNYVIKDVIASMRSAPRNIMNARGYLLTALFNAASTYEIGLDVEINRDMFRKAEKRGA